MSDFFDITEPGEFLPEPATPWWIWLGLGVVTLALVGLLYFIIRKLKTTKQNASLLDEAREQLHKLKIDSANMPTHMTANRISLILRRYLEAAFDDPALFETNEEFTLRDTALQQLHPDSRQSVIQHLNALSELKYAPQNSIEVTTLIDEAETIIANIEINVGDSDHTK